MAAGLPELCDLTRRLLAALVGSRVERREWVGGGDIGCTFVLRPRQTAAPQ